MKQKFVGWTEKEKNEKPKEKHGNKRREENERKNFLFIFRNKKNGKME